jgi:hypothetical protein
MGTGRRRRAYRRTVSWQVIVLAGLDRVPAEIVDVTELGAKIISAKEMPPVSNVTIVSERLGPLEARVVWRNGPAAGLEFTEEEADEKILPLLGAIKLPARFGKRR